MGLHTDLRDWARLQRRATLAGLEVKLDSDTQDYDVYDFYLDGRRIRRNKTLAGSLNWIDGFEQGLAASTPRAVHPTAAASTEGES